MDIVNPQIERYIGSIYGERSEILKEMEDEAVRLNFPIIGPLAGKLLYQLAKMVGARKIFEMGSGYGYSAFWWASAINDGNEAGDRGEMILTDKSDANRQKGEAYLGRAGLVDDVKYKVGDALEIFDGTSGEFDIVFIDIEKAQYPAALAKAAGRIRRGGLLVADNVLWSGKVIEEKGDASTEGIKQFNRRLFSMDEFASTIVPIRDGVAVGLKL